MTSIYFSISYAGCMDADEALRFVEELIHTYGGKPLNDLQRTVFRGSWRGYDYKEIHRECEQVGFEHLTRNVGPELWQSLSYLLTNLLEETIVIRKKSLQGPIQRLHDRLRSQISVKPEITFEPLDDTFNGWINFENLNRKQSWGSAPAVTAFQGRSRELLELEQWIEDDACRLIALVGTAGMGKTALSTKLAEHLRDRFEFVVWRSLDPVLTGQPPPALPDLLGDLLGILSDQPHSRHDLSQLLQQMREHRCLIVLDGFDAVLQSNVLSGEYLAGYEGYGNLLRQIGSTHHSSCLMLTGREKPVEVEEQEGHMALVRSQRVWGMRTTEVQSLLSLKGSFTASEPDWRSLVHQLVQHYDGNPRFIQQVATTITHAFGRDVSHFLNSQQNRAIFVGDIRRLLDQQIGRLSPPELTIIRQLAQHREPATLEEIGQFVTGSMSRHDLLEVLLSLVRRSLLNNSSASYSLQPLIAEYVTECL